MLDEIMNGVQGRTIPFRRSGCGATRAAESNTEESRTKCTRIEIPFCSMWLMLLNTQ